MVSNIQQYLKNFMKLGQLYKIFYLDSDFT